MAIIRVKHNQDYVVMNKTGLADPDLSFKAKGILAFLLSKPDNWKCRRKHLAKVGPDGITAVRTGLKELREKGYLESKAIRDEEGKIKEWESIIREVPKKPSEKETAQKAENQPGGSSTRRKSNQHNKYLNLRSNDLKIEEEERTREKNIPVDIRVKYEEIFNRTLSTQIYNKILKFYSDPKIIMKALLIAEEKGDKPSYLLKLLSDWQNHGLTSISNINTYLANRQAQNGNKREYKRYIKDKSLEEMKKDGWR
ncbi:MAG: DnaD domain protein [Spirochaetota bacterium]